MEGYLGSTSVYNDWPILAQPSPNFHMHCVRELWDEESLLTTNYLLSAIVVKDWNQRRGEYDFFPPESPPDHLNTECALKKYYYALNDDDNDTMTTMMTTATTSQATTFPSNTHIWGQISAGRYKRLNELSTHLSLSQSNGRAGRQMGVCSVLDADQNSRVFDISSAGGRRQ